MAAKTIDISAARKQFNRMNERLQGATKVLYVTRHNRPAFAIVDNEYLEMLMETIDILSDRDAMELLQRSLEDIQAGRLHDHEDVKRQLL